MSIDSPNRVVRQGMRTFISVETGSAGAPGVRCMVMYDSFRPTLRFHPIVQPLSQVVVLPATLSLK